MTEVSVMQKSKITASDVLTATVYGVAYWLHGDWQFPAGIKAEEIITSVVGNKCYMDILTLDKLIKKLAEATDMNLGSLSAGSVPVYINYIRKGHKPNFKGDLPPLSISFSRKTGLLHIGSRSYREDVESGMIKYLPMWLF